MKLEMTARDMKLIKLALSVLVLVAVIRLLILPQVEKIQDANLRLEEVTAEADAIQAKIDEIPLLEAEKEQRAKELAELSAPYYGSLENREIDELVTNIALEHNLFPISLSIGEEKAEIPNPYLYSSGGITDPVVGAGDSAASGASTDDALSGDSSTGASGSGASSDDLLSGDSSTDGASSGSSGSSSSGASDGSSTDGSSGSSSGASDGSSTDGSSGSSTDGSSGDTSTSASEDGYLHRTEVTMVLRGDKYDVMAFLDDVQKSYPSIQLKSMQLAEETYANEALEAVKKTRLDCVLIIDTCSELE